MLYNPRRIFEIKFVEVFDLNQGKLKKFLATFLIGACAVSFPITSDAKRLHDPEVETKSDMRDFSAQNEEKNFRLTKEEAELVAPEENYYPTPKVGMLFSGAQVSDDSILGQPVATQKQCVKYLTANNPNPRLGVSAEEIVAYYYEEGMREGVRPDLAFAQALKETGFFRYGGDVVPEQNNYCGLGTTGGGVRGLYFSSPQIGVRAHIQHLLAYTSTRRPTTEIVDPRYNIVRARYGANILSKWYDLNGRWAVPGHHYGQDILKMLKDILVQ